MDQSVIEQFIIEAAQGAQWEIVNRSPSFEGDRPYFLVFFPCSPSYHGPRHDLTIVWENNGSVLNVGGWWKIPNFLDRYLNNNSKGLDLCDPESMNSLTEYFKKIYNLRRPDGSTKCDNQQGNANLSGSSAH